MKIHKRPMFFGLILLAFFTLTSCAGYQTVGQPLPPPAPLPVPDEPVISESPTELKIQLDGDVLFDFDRAIIRPKADAVLEQVAEIIKQYQNPDILIGGHTDSRGEENYNLDLSDRRAVAVKDWLIKKGRVSGRIVTRGYGELKPVAPNENPDGSDNPEGRQSNRRVEIIVKKETFSPKS
ncbi:MAG: OmpA family protein [Deltaproteobacteria bacterium]